MKYYIDVLAKNKTTKTVDCMFGKYVKVDVVKKPPKKPLKMRIRDCIDVFFGRQTAVVFLEDCPLFPLEYIKTKKGLSTKNNGEAISLPGKVYNLHKMSPE